tara:strand:+ start:706 stop:915 length:210 start_codon:yes stop_codon:yes gene_type:complete
MRNYFKQFTGKIQYQDPKPNEINFELEENADLTDEIEKSLIEIKNTWNIPEDEINAAIKSRKLSKNNRN